MNPDMLCKVGCVVAVVALIASCAALFMTFTDEEGCDTFTLYVGMGDRIPAEVAGIEMTIANLISDEELAYTHWTGNGASFVGDVEFTDKTTLIYRFVDADEDDVMDIVHAIHRSLDLTVFLECGHSHDTQLLIPRP